MGIQLQRRGEHMKMDDLWERKIEEYCTVEQHHHVWNKREKNGEVVSHKGSQRFDQSFSQYLSLAF